MTQVVILSDTFSEFAQPLMKQLDWPMIWCNDLIVGENGIIEGYRMRLNDGKRQAIEALKELNFRTFAAGDSYNDLTMIHTADGGCLFRAPAKILEEEPDLKLSTTYDEFLQTIREFLQS